jgi:hypothetical protein
MNATLVKAYLAELARIPALRGGNSGIAAAAAATLSTPIEMAPRVSKVDKERLRGEKILPLFLQRMANLDPLLLDLMLAEYDGLTPAIFENLAFLITGRMNLMFAGSRPIKPPNSNDLFVKPKITGPQDVKRIKAEMRNNLLVIICTRNLAMPRELRKFLEEADMNVVVVVATPPASANNNGNNNNNDDDDDMEEEEDEKEEEDGKEKNDDASLTPAKIRETLNNLLFALFINCPLAVLFMMVAVFERQNELTDYYQAYPSLHQLCMDLCYFMTVKFDVGLARVLDFPLIEVFFDTFCKQAAVVRKEKEEEERQMKKDNNNNEKMANRPPTLAKITTTPPVSAINNNNKKKKKRKGFMLIASAAADDDDDDDDDDKEEEEEKGIDMGDFLEDNEDKEDGDEEAEKKANGNVYNAFMHYCQSLLPLVRPMYPVQWARMGKYTAHPLEAMLLSIPFIMQQQQQKAQPLLVHRIVKLYDRVTHYNKKIVPNNPMGFTVYFQFFTETHLRMCLQDMVHRAHLQRK